MWQNLALLWRAPMSSEYKDNSILCRGPINQLALTVTVQEMYLFFHLFFPPKFVCTPCVCYNKIPPTRWLKQHNFNFSSARSTSCQAWFLVRALSDLHVAAFSLWPHVVFPLCARMGEISVFHRVSHSYEDTNPSGSGPHPYDFIYDFTLNYLPKGPSSKLSHMEG